MNSEVQMAQEDITPILDHLRARGYIIIDFIQRSESTRQPISTISNGRFQTKQQAVNELIFIARQMYRLIENCEDANVAIPSIFGNWVP